MTIIENPSTGLGAPVEMTTKTTDPDAFLPVQRPSSAIEASSSSDSKGSDLLRNVWFVLRKTGDFLHRVRWEIGPAVVTSSLTVIGYAQDGRPAYTAVYAVTSLVTGLVALNGVKHKNDHLFHLAGGFSLALADIAVASGLGPGWFSATAWLLVTTGVYAKYGHYLKESRHQRMKLHLDTLKATGPVPAAMGMEAADPGLTGMSPEETALRRAIYAMSGAIPQAVEGFSKDSTGWSCIVTMPPGKATSPATLCAKKDQLATNLNMGGKLVLTEGPGSAQFTVRLILKDTLAETIPYRPQGRASVMDPVRLGIDESGDPFMLKLVYRHTLIAGATDWGKSGLIQLIIMRLLECPDDVELYGIDMKPGAPELGPWASRFVKIATNPQEARDLLLEFETDARSRGDFLRKLSNESLARGQGPIRKWSREYGKFKFLIIDELGELSRQSTPKKGGKKERPNAEILEASLALIRFLGEQIIAATQQPSRGVFGGKTDARGNYANRLSTRQGESGHAQFVFGQDCRSRGYAPEMLDLPGKFMAATPECERSTIYRAEYVSDQDLAGAVGFAYSSSSVPVVDDDEPDEIPVIPLYDEYEPEEDDSEPTLVYPDGTPVEDPWPEYWETFVAMGIATKNELAAKHGCSRDTVRRAFEVWTQHGVKVKPHYSGDKFFIPVVLEK